MLSAVKNVLADASSVGPLSEQLLALKTSVNTFFAAFIISATSLILSIFLDWLKSLYSDNRNNSGNRSVNKSDNIY